MLNIYMYIMYCITFIIRVSSLSNGKRYMTNTADALSPMVQMFHLHAV